MDVFKACHSDGAELRGGVARVDGKFVLEVSRDAADVPHTPRTYPLRIAIEPVGNQQRIVVAESDATPAGQPWGPPK